MIVYFCKLMSDTKPQIQEVGRTQSRINANKTQKQNKQTKNTLHPSMSFSNYREPKIRITPERAERWPSQRPLLSCFPARSNPPLQGSGSRSTAALSLTPRQAGVATVHFLYQGLSPPIIVPPEAQKAVLGCSWVQVSTQEGVGEGRGRGFEHGGSSWNVWRHMLAHLTEAGGKIGKD